MFRPSQNLLFRPMPSLNKFKIHPPLPLNPRESKQLLNLLTTSFRQQLDAEHGEFRKDPKLSNAQKGQEKTRRRMRSFSDSNARPTDRHMNLILTNPLFVLNTDGKALAANRDPMELFDIAVAKGMMTINYARACLNAKKHEIIQSPVPTIREGMKESGAGLKVLRWLVSSGTANNNDFLMSAPFAQILMEYLVAEGLQEVCWKWIQRGFQSIPQYFATHGEENQVLHKTLRREIVTPLYHLVKAEASGDVSLDSAYLCLSRAVGYLAGSPAGRLRDLLSGAGWYLVYESTELHSQRPPPTPSAFDSFFSLIPVLSKNPGYQLAHMSLIHPFEPSTDLALAFLRQLTRGFRQQRSKTMLTSTWDWTRQKLYWRMDVMRMQNG
ncbi:hypothetical protein D0Z07_3826 [Hyphodiscus hymeniophilus]|uniref:Uncharacterized protein n=1 Tax=Hyphodiscus hymeniophilus TaxID=353542 RepID=A0A9P7AYC2_9HELO|nr:hypothetical protein D0Z07_3826 [Hyphodiscus hymeniophilus]